MKMKFERMNNIAQTLAVLIALAVIGTWIFNKNFRETVSEASDRLASAKAAPKAYTVDGATAQTASKPIGGNLYQVHWQKSGARYGTAITSHKDIKVGDLVSISTVSSGEIGYFQYVTDRKPSGTTSW